MSAAAPRLGGRVLITAGPTLEPIDDVRFISNASTGAQGTELAREALRRGYSVDLVHGPLGVRPPRKAALHPVRTAREMLGACLALHPRVRIVIGAAAVADYRPRARLRGKRPRGKDPWRLELLPTEDILARLSKRKGNRIHAGFALESPGPGRGGRDETLVRRAAAKLRAKGLDWIVANSPDAIGAPEARYLLLGREGLVLDLGRRTKRELAAALFDAIEGRLPPARARLAPRRPGRKLSE